jgi:hypothetical protein
MAKVALVFGTGFRDRFSGQVFGTGFRDRFSGQVFGTDGEFPARLGFLVVHQRRRKKVVNGGNLGGWRASSTNHPP